MSFGIEGVCRSSVLDEQEAKHLFLMCNSLEIPIVFLPITCEHTNSDEIIFSKALAEFQKHVIW